jgi:hypothetical protein
MDKALINFSFTINKRVKRIMETKPGKSSTLHLHTTELLWMLEWEIK